MKVFLMLSLMSFSFAPLSYSDDPSRKKEYCENLKKQLAVEIMDLETQLKTIQDDATNKIRETLANQSIKIRSLYHNLIAETPQEAFDKIQEYNQWSRDLKDFPELLQDLEKKYPPMILKFLKVPFETTLKKFNPNDYVENWNSILYAPSAGVVIYPKNGEVKMFLTQNEPKDRNIVVTSYSVLFKNEFHTAPEMTPPAKIPMTNLLEALRTYPVPITGSFQTAQMGLENRISYLKFDGLPSECR